MAHCDADCKWEETITSPYNTAQVTPVSRSIPWLGFVVYPTHRCVKARKVRNTTRHLCERFDAYRLGEISFAEFDASVKGWVNHVRYADSWGLRKHVFSRLANRPKPSGKKS
jgi:RNA-directed DNA polymerase